MPNIRSAAKRMRQNVGRRANNRANNAAMRTSIKKLTSAIDGGDAKIAAGQLNETTSVIGKAAQKGLIHKNNAARRISRLTKKINVLAAAPAVVPVAPAVKKAAKSSAKSAKAKS